MYITIMFNYFCLNVNDILKYPENLVVNRS